MQGGPTPDLPERGHPAPETDRTRATQSWPTGPVESWEACEQPTMTAEGTMRIAIIGTGKMGRGFAWALAATHEVIVGSRDPDKAHDCERSAKQSLPNSWIERLTGRDRY